MLYMNEFITKSLDLNLFFLRIMKEHAFFLELGFAPKDAKMASDAKNFRMEFERLLTEAVELSNGNVSYEAVESRQLVTQYTSEAEKLTGFYTGKPFNLNLTRREMMLSPSGGRSSDIERRVDMLNHRAFRLTSSLADFKGRLLQDVLSCKTFTTNYPSMIQHMLAEASYYMEMLESLIEKKHLAETTNILNEEVFWNDKMSGHAKVMAGQFDPSEGELINIARMLAQEFDELINEAKVALTMPCASAAVTYDSTEATQRLRAFKISGLEGLWECRIRSIIIPILADHILREANYYLCKLGECNMMEQ
ncbi:MAG: hypothetical protein CVU91_00675 [Firmicutes bacterium HGW-Firmicutes-16]|nr:MAG: hypothetical protein CVU91_00675 [Firmicutes bacterium HGW-Firmicutes-16]